MEQNVISLKKYSHKVGLNVWHFVFVTKYRYKMFGKFKQNNIADASIRKAASSHNIGIRVLKVMPDHAHMTATLPRGMSESDAFQFLKGWSAYHFFKNHPKSRLRLPKGHLWGAGGCATTVGCNELSTVENYIRNQEQHHATA